MKKNIRYRNNNNNNNYNQIYSLNYKFDSTSIAGKCSGTALDLIKRYNELAKEAQGNGDYVNAEVFRQYAEHYRKIVTEINERKNAARPFHENNKDENQEAAEEKSESGVNTTENAQTEEKKVAQEQVLEQNTNTSEVVVNQAPTKKEFKVIEISSVNSNSVPEIANEEGKKVSKPRGRRKVSENAASL